MGWKLIQISAFAGLVSGVTILEQQEAKVCAIKNALIVTTPISNKCLVILAPTATLLPTLKETASPVLQKIIEDFSRSLNDAFVCLDTTIMELPNVYNVTLHVLCA